MADYPGTINAQVNKIWRKSQGRLAKGFNFVTPEFRWIGQFRELQIDASLREMTYPVDLIEDRNVTMLPESGRLAQPSSVNAVDATVQFTHANARFSASFLARWADQADNGRGEIERQISFQGMKKVEAMGRVLGDQFYGFSTGVEAVVGGMAGNVVTLKDAYGSPLIPGGTDTQNRYIANLFKKGDRIAFVRAGNLIPNGIVEVVQYPDVTGPSLMVQGLNGAALPAAAADDEIVFANGAEPTELAHTSYQLTLSGLLEFTTSISVHGIAETIEPHWSVAFSDDSGGRFNGMRWRHGVQEIQNYGNADAVPQTLFAQGVYRDVVAQFQAGVRYLDPFDLEIDGDLKGDGRRFRDSRRVPPGMVFMYDPQRGAIRRKTIHDEVDEPGWGDGREREDEAFWTFPIDWAGLLCTQNRKLFSYWSDLEELPAA